MDIVDKIYVILSSKREFEEKSIKMKCYPFSRGLDYIFYLLILPVLSFFIIGGVFSFLIYGLSIFLLIKVSIYFLIGVEVKES